MTIVRVCVIYNPSAGRGRARRRVDELRKKLGELGEFRPTHAPGDGEQLALEAANAGYRVVAAVGGDGTVHEVANGLLRACNPCVQLAILPAGSANDFAYSLGLDDSGQRRRDAMPLAPATDVGLVQAAGRQRYFVNGLGLGFNGAVTQEARRIRWLRGLPLYSLALFRALCWHFEQPPMRVTLDDHFCESPTLALTVNLGNREGGFLLAPQAQLDDGWFDYVHAGPLRRWQLLRYFPALVTGRLPEGHPLIRLGRCQKARVESPTPLTVHLDGEFFCTAADRIHEIEVSLLPRVLPVYRPGG